MRHSFAQSLGMRYSEAQLYNKIHGKNKRLFSDYVKNEKNKKNEVGNDKSIFQVKLFK